MKEEEDQISLLPDCLLVDIISRLSDTAKSIRTGILSKRWQRLWTQLTNLTFFNNYRIRSCFYSFVDKILDQCSSQLNLNSFRLRTFPCTEFKSKINDWILYATKRNVQELELHFWNHYRFELDQFIFTNSCFTHLKLECCSLNPTCAITWNKLKSLYIGDMRLDKDLIQSILSGSPLLETLELKFCYGPFSRIDITSKSVKNLVFFGYYNSVHSMEINAPHIQSLTIKSNVRLHKFSLHDVSSLVKAKLDYHNKKRNCKTTYEEDAELEMLKGFLLSLRHVKELKIGKRCLQVLSRLEAKGFVFPPDLRLADDSDSGETD